IQSRSRPSPPVAPSASVVQPAPSCRSSRTGIPAAGRPVAASRTWLVTVTLSPPLGPFLRQPPLQPQPGDRGQLVPDDLPLGRRVVAQPAAQDREQLV